MKIMDVKEYLEFLDLFGFVVVKGTYDKPTLVIPEFFGEEKDLERVWEYLSMSPIMENVLETTVKKYDRVRKMPDNKNYEEWNKKFETLNGLLATYRRGGAIFVSGKEFRKS